MKSETCTYCTEPPRNSIGRRAATTLVALAVATSIGAGHALADPEQGGASPTDPGPSQGGSAPSDPGTQGGSTPPPAPAPQAPAPAPNWDGPGTVPAPPQTLPSVTWTPPTYNAPYNPIPVAPIVVRPAAPVNPIKPPPGKIRVGNFITDIPDGMADSDVRSINRWSAYQEAQITQGLIAAGVPKDKAARHAASTMIGVALGGAAGAAAVGIPAALIGGTVGGVVGLGVGAVAGTVSLPALAPILTPFVGPVAAPIVGVGGATVAGGLGGAALGAAAVGGAGAVAGGTVGAILGGILAYTLGAGDPGANPGSPTDPSVPESDPGYTLPAPNAKADQYVLVLGNKDSKLPGGPNAKYVVRNNGAVNGHVSVASHRVNFGWSAEQADAGFRALGFGSQTARDAAKAWTYSTGRQAIKTINGLQISFPQSVKPGQTPPTDGTVGQAEIDRQNRLQRARDRARSAPAAPPKAAPAAQQAAAPQAMPINTPSPLPAVAPVPPAAPKVLTPPPAPRVTALVPPSAPAPVKDTARQIDRLLHPGR